MIFSAIDQRIRRAFSDAATQYDVLSSLQKEIGRELVKRIDHLEHARYILDIGMGTGWMTNRLSNLFPDAKVAGIDCALGMIEQARKKYEGLRAVQADARMLPFTDAQFDIVISNLSYQWVGGLTKAFGEAGRVLKKNGVLCLTMFGRETLKELFVSLEAVKGDKFTVERLAGKEEIESALRQCDFRDIILETETIKTHFPDMFSLMKWLKDIGANVLPKNGFIGKELMREAGEYYDKNFREHLGIVSTFEVVWIKAKH